MADDLSQEEIDLLLSGGPQKVKAPVVALDNEDLFGHEIAKFDFRLPHRLSKNQLRTLQTIHEAFSESFGSYLISRLQTRVSITVTSVDQVFYSEYVLSVPSPSCLFVFRLEEQDALMLFEFNSQLVMAMVARLLGGQSDLEKKPRVLTRIEQRIAKGIAQRATIDLQNAWKAIADLTFISERYEIEGDFAQIAPLSEIVLLVSLEIVFGDQKYLMNVCFSTFALEHILAKLNTQNITALSIRKEDGDWSNILKQQVSTTNIELVGLLGTTSLTIRELLELEKDNVIKTSIPENSDAQIVIGKKPRFWGRAGISNGRFALKITRVQTDTKSK